MENGKRRLYNYNIGKLKVPMREQTAKYLFFGLKASIHTNIFILLYRLLVNRSKSDTTAAADRRPTVVLNFAQVANMR